jgi:uncharacterized membrane protein
MEPKRSKYDTNPLDKKVADSAEQSMDSSRPAPPTQDVAGGPTHDIGRTRNETARRHPESEAPTQRIDGDLASSYPSVFIKPPPRPTAAYQPPRVPVESIYQPPPGPFPSVYQPPQMSATERPLLHSVAGLGIPERWANLLPYVPGHIGAIAAVIELLLVPRTETRTRFHAAQGLALQVAILIISGAFGLLSAITGSSFGSGLFRAATTIFLIVSMIRAFKGKTHHIAPLDDATRWLDEKIKPRK